MYFWVVLATYKRVLSTKLVITIFNKRPVSDPIHGSFFERIFVYLINRVVHIMVVWNKNVYSCRTVARCDRKCSGFNTKNRLSIDEQGLPQTTSLVLVQETRGVNVQDLAIRI